MLKRILIIGSCVVAIILLCGCEREECMKKITLPETLVESECEEVYLLEKNEENLVCIKLSLDDRFNEEQTRFVENFVVTELHKMTGVSFDLKKSNDMGDYHDEEYYNYYINLESKVSYVSNDAVSIIFSGVLNKKSAAHPLHLLFSLNFDPNTMNVIQFSERHAIDDALYEEFALEGEKRILEECGGKWPEGWKSFSETLCSKETFVKSLKNDNEYSEVEWYYTEDGMGFSYSVAYSLGGHKEVELTRKLD